LALLVVGLGHSYGLRISAIFQRNRPSVCPPIFSLSGETLREQGTKSGKPIGRARVDPKIEDTIRASLAGGKGILKTARECKVGSSTVQRVKAAMAG
jgi:hypothetical protein